VADEDLELGRADCSSGGGRISPRFGTTTAAATPKATTASFPAGAGAVAGSRRSRGAQRSFPRRPRVRASSSGQREPSLSLASRNLGSRRGPCFLGSFAGLGAGPSRSRRQREVRRRTGAGSLFFSPPWRRPLLFFLGIEPAWSGGWCGWGRRADRWVRGPHPALLPCGVS
jgi:hypothetical protein